MKNLIAIIEDDELIRSMIQINLNKSNYDTDVFSSCEAVTPLVSMKKYDLIIMDIILPGI
jgi:DNA-binding response OmpR family regulator